MTAQQIVDAMPAGRVVGPDDPGWDAERRGFNLQVDQRPYAVIHPGGVDDVIATVRHARRHGITVAAQPVGHAASKRFDGTILLRTAAFDRLSVDADRRVAYVGAGVRWARLNAALAGTGLTGLPGSTDDVSVTGYTLNGGLSWFGRRHGLASHHVRAVELVTPDAEHVRVTADSDPELFWALRGAGGEFGIVTGLEIDLLPAPHVFGGRMVWPVRHAHAVLDCFLELTTTAPRDLTLWVFLLNLPDVPGVPEPLRGRWTVALDLTYLGTAEDAEVHLASLARLPVPTMDTRRLLGTDELRTITADPTEPTPLTEKAMLLDGLDTADLSALIAPTCTKRPSPLLGIQVRHLAGALREEPQPPAALSTIEEPYGLIAVALPPTPDDAVAATYAQRDIGVRLAHRDTGRQPGTFATEPSKAYAVKDLHRLRQLKRARDPTSVIGSHRPLRTSPA